MAHQPKAIKGRVLVQIADSEPTEVGTIEIPITLGDPHEDEQVDHGGWEDR